MNDTINDINKERLPARTDHTSWINQLTDEEIAIFHSAILQCENNWGPHDPVGSGALSYKNPGQTIWLHDKWPTSDWIHYEDSSINLITDLLKTITIKYNLGIMHGRSYVHRLRPGDDVSPHKDVNDWNYFQMIDRYHLYIDIPDGANILMGGPLAPNSILLFRHDLIHSYINNSKSTLTFVVFDIFR